MTKITSNVTYDASQLESLAFFRDNSVSSQFYNNGFLDPRNGIRYEDTLLILLNDGTSKTIADFNGSSLVHIGTEHFQLDQTDTGIEPSDWGEYLKLYLEITDTTANANIHEICHSLGLRHPNDDPTDQHYTTNDARLSNNYISTGADAPSLTKTDIAALAELWSKEKFIVNGAPTNLTLSASAFDENIAAGTTIATLGTTDPDAGDTFSYSLGDLSNRTPQNPQIGR